jgi:hypothetical protein
LSPNSRAACTAWNLARWRLTLVDILYQIGGSDAIDVSLEQLHRTADPVEIAQLGWYLEQLAPGEYREEVLKAIRETLQWAAHIPPENRDDMSPLFALLQAYSGPEVVADLERSRPTWWEYSLLALAALPAGEGVQHLATLAGDPHVPLAYKPQLPFRRLAQASVHHPEAGVALIELARAGQIPDQAWSQVGTALEGQHLQFSHHLGDGMPLHRHGANGSGIEDLLARQDESQPQTVSYAQQFAAAQWSAEQIEQQLALIEALLDATPSPAAVAALRQARESLRHGRH